MDAKAFTAEPLSLTYFGHQFTVHLGGDEFVYGLIEHEASQPQCGAMWMLLAFHFRHMKAVAFVGRGLSEASCQSAQGMGVHVQHFQHQGEALHWLAALMK